MSKSNSTLTAERLREVLDYDPETGVFVWRIRTSSRAGASDTAGFGDGKGYLAIRVDGAQVFAHRLAWFWVHGAWPNGVIDHIDGITTNNAIRNLRDVNHASNMQNLKGAKRDNAASGLLGVVPSRDKWVAQIRVGRKKYHLGVYLTPEEAHHSYLVAKRLFHPGCTI